MIPIYLDPAAVRVALIGRSALCVRRLAWLKASGAEPDIWSDAPSPELVAISDTIARRLPSGDEIKRYQAIWIADLPPEVARELADAARAVGVLVNVEDVPALCDFHTPAVTRRGRLTLAAGTGGASPAVTRAVRERLETTFPDVWGVALDEIADARTVLRSEGASVDALVEDARTRLARHGLA